MLLQSLGKLIGSVLILNDALGYIHNSKWVPPGFFIACRRFRKFKIFLNSQHLSRNFGSQQANNGSKVAHSSYSYLFSGYNVYNVSNIFLFHLTTGIYLFYTNF